jgi:hypothetical protein
MASLMTRRRGQILVATALRAVLLALRGNNPDGPQGRGYNSSHVTCPDD